MLVRLVLNSASSDLLPQPPNMLGLQVGVIVPSLNIDLLGHNSSYFRWVFTDRGKTVGLG